MVLDASLLLPTDCRQVDYEFGIVDSTGRALFRERVGSHHRGLKGYP